MSCSITISLNSVKGRKLVINENSETFEKYLVLTFVEPTRIHFLTFASTLPKQVTLSITKRLIAYKWFSYPMESCYKIGNSVIAITGHKLIWFINTDAKGTLYNPLVRAFLFTVCVVRSNICPCSLLNILFYCYNTDMPDRKKRQILLDVWSSIDR